MNKINSKVLSAEDKFTAKFHLKQPGFTYSACGVFTEHREKVQKFKLYL